MLLQIADNLLRDHRLDLGSSSPERSGVGDSKASAPADCNRGNLFAINNGCFEVDFRLVDDVRKCKMERSVDLRNVGSYNFTLVADTD